MRIRAKEEYPIRIMVREVRTVNRVRWFFFPITIVAHTSKAAMIRSKKREELMKGIPESTTAVLAKIRVLLRSLLLRM